MKLVLTKKQLRYIWIVIYVFISVFSPPILPISLVYIWAVLTIFLLINVNKKKISEIIHRSKMKTFIRSIFILLFMLIITSMLNIEETSIFFVNWLKCINQLIVLNCCQLIFVIYIIFYLQKYGYDFNDLLKIIIIIGIIQSICAGLAYQFPMIRTFFLKYGDQNLYGNAYFIERRGYGFSMTLIDMFGYGMGLACGYLILKKNIFSLITRFIYLFLGLFTLFINSRTGVLFLLLSIVFLFVDKTISLKTIIKILGLFVFLYCMLVHILPIIINILNTSSNTTVHWVGEGFLDIYDFIFNSKSLETTSSISGVWKLPDSFLQFMFGTGHSCYGTKAELGFATDIGYINMIWIYGITGVVIYNTTIYYIGYRALKLSRDFKSDFRCIMFTILLFIIVQVKGNVLGYNPGIMITYLVFFSAIFFKNGRKGSEIN